MNFLYLDPGSGSYIIQILIGALGLIAAFSAWLISRKLRGKSGGQVLAVIGIIVGVIGLLAFGIPLGILALICGIIAVAMGFNLGFFAIVLGVIDVLAAILVGSLIL